MQKQQKTSAQQLSAVTLSMEVSYPFHSHLIGRSGQNVNRIMEETGTRVHFPDRNRIAGHSKSNKVVIRGQIPNLENARQRIRAFVPVEFVVDCNNERITALGQSALSTHFSSFFGVLLRFYPKIDGVSCQVNIRGQPDRVDRLKEAVAYLCHVTQTVLESVVMKIETSFDHVWLVRDHVDTIVTKSGAGIRCPDLSSLKELPKKYSVWIRGSMEAAYNASELLMGLLPLQIMLQMPSAKLTHRIISTAEELDVLLHAETSIADTLNVRLTSYEWNAYNLYDLVRQCLGLASSQQPCLQRQPRIWHQLHEMTRSTFLSASKRLFKELSLSKQSVKPISTCMVEVPQCSPDSLSTTMSTLSVGTESSIPVSLTASRFDPNSYRHLAGLLETVGLSHYTELFLRNEVDMAMFTTLNDEDFVSIGISSFGARKIMLNIIQELRR